MEDHDTLRFMEILAKTMGGYAKPLPDAEMVKVWKEWLAPYPLRTITIAFAEYCNEEATFPPTPAAIVKRCKALDGRPDAEEAWALALTCRDEAATTIWTSEIAEAFDICKVVLDSGDKIGARMAFKEAYKRLVLAARIRNQPVCWTASIGWDKEVATLALEKAVRSGQLAIESVPILLPAPTVAVNQAAEDEKARENLKRIKNMMAELLPASEKRRRAQERQYQAERDALASAKQDAAKRVSEFQGHTYA